MIKVNRLNNEEFYINCDQIEFIEATPETVVSLISGRKAVVLQTPDEIIGLVAEYKRRIYSGPSRNE